MKFNASKNIYITSQWRHRTFVRTCAAVHNWSLDIDKQITTTARHNFCLRGEPHKAVISRIIMKWSFLALCMYVSKHTVCVF